MIQVSILIAWVAAGVAAAALIPRPGESRFAFAPIAMILGPLWLAIAAEQQTAPARVEVSSRANRN